MGKLSAFNYLFHKSNLDTLLSVNFSKNSTWAACFQLNYAQIQHGSLSYKTFSTNPKLTDSVLSNEIRCLSCPQSSCTQLHTYGWINEKNGMSELMDMKPKQSGGEAACKISFPFPISWFVQRGCRVWDNTILMWDIGEWLTGRIL
jgi:adenosine deaminase